MGIYRLLLGVEDKELINDYLTNTIGKIIKYDAENKTNLCETLECYLRNNGSVNETSKEMFVHRNTINYKLNKLEEILDADLSSLELRMQLMMALKLRVMIM
jgi:DNA-binding PucR family transcriptional regulator